MSTEVIDNPAEATTTAAPEQAVPEVFKALAKIKPILSPELIAAKAQRVLDTIAAFEIDSDLMYETAAEELLAIKAQHTHLENERLERATPLTAASNFVNGTYRGPKSYLESAETMLKDKMVAYQDAKEAAALAKQKELDAQAEAERLRLANEAAALAKKTEEEAAALTQQADQAAEAGDLAAAHHLQQQAEQVKEAAVDVVAALEQTSQVLVAPVVSASVPKVGGISTTKKLKAEVEDRIKLIKHIAANIDKEPALGFLFTIVEQKLQGWVTTHGDKLNLPGVKVVPVRSISGSRGAAAPRAISSPSVPPSNHPEPTMAKSPFTPAVDCTKEQRPLIVLTPITSNKLHAVGYDPVGQVFAAQFAPGGAIYHYEGFTPEQHQAFQEAESKGRHFGQHIQTLPSKKYSADPVAKTEDTTADA